MPPVYPKSSIALLDARVVAATWAALLLVGIALMLFLVMPTIARPVLKVSVPVFILLAVAHVALSFQHQCPVCSKRPTIQGFAPVHSDSKSQSALEGWGGAVVNILRRRRLICIHCGSEFRVQP